MRFSITHRTLYEYAAPVQESFNEVRLQPFNNGSQTVENFLLKILPSSRLRHYHDFYSNTVHHFEIPEPHKTLLVESTLSVMTRPVTALAPELTPWPLARLGESTRDSRAYDFLQDSRYVQASPEVWKLALDVTDGARDVWQAVLALMKWVHGNLSYIPRSTHVHTHARDVFRERRGVCQDYAHVMLCLCRTLKIPALYVSGYLATETASATHAWVEVFIPTIGWRGLDPTHNRQTDETYVKIAVGRDYADVPPITGNYKGTTDHKMKVEVTIKQHS
jgi:transglutaminase-like putative cysteine protease